MVQFAGKYEHSSNENLKEFILAVGNNEAFSTKADAAKSTIEVSVSGSSYTIKGIYPAKTVSVTFAAGAEFDDELPDGGVLKSIATVSENKISVTSKKDGTEVGGRTYEFSDDGLIITMIAKSTPITAKRIYKRV